MMVTATGINKKCPTTEIILDTTKETDQLLRSSSADGKQCILGVVFQNGPRGYLIDHNFGVYEMKIWMTLLSLNSWGEVLKLI